MLNHILAWPWRGGGKRFPALVKIIKKICRVVLIVGREFRRDQVPLRAAALAFAVLLSLVPVLALGTAVMKGLGGAGHLRATVHALVDRLGGEPPAAGGQEGEERPPALIANLHRAVDQVFAYVDRTNFATLGTIGIIGVFWAALSVLGNIERAMNAIWHTRVQRGVFRKVVDYLALTLLLPLSVNIGLAAMTALASPKIKNFLLLFIPDPVLLARLLGLVPAALLVLTFTTMYAFLPNTRVSRAAALAGGVVGAVGWMAFQAVYLKLQFGVARYNAIYGSFAILPLFFLWLHMSWMIFLTGAEVSFAVQNHATYHWHRRPSSPLARLRLAVEILTCAAESFAERKGFRPAEIVMATGAQDGEVRELIELLHENNLLRREGEVFFPAAPPDKIPLAEVCGLVLGRLPGESGPAGIVARAVEEAARGVDITGQRPGKKTAG